MSQLPPYDDDVMPTQADDDGFEEEDFKESRKEILTRLRNNYAGWGLEPATFGPLLQTIRDGEKVVLP